MNSPLQNVLARLEGVRPVGENQHEARCPNHDDRTASLSVTSGDDGRVLLHCHAGCPVDAVVSSAGLTLKDLFRPRENNGYNDVTIKNGCNDATNSPGHASNGKARGTGKGKSSKPQGTFDCAYDYRDEQGRLLFQVCRYENPKDFRQRRQDASGNWSWKVRGTRSVLYRLPELIASPDEVVFLCEGEKDADALTKLGLTATTNPGGAAMGGAKFKAEHVELLRGRNVVILPDADDVGRDHAKHVAAKLCGVAASVKILELAGLEPKGDVSDWLAAGGTAEQLRMLADECAEFDPSGTKPGIIIGVDEERMTDQAIAALAKLPRDENGVYQRGDALMRITKSPPKARGIERPKGAPSIAPIPAASLREKIATAATFYKMDGEGDLTPTSVPASVVAAVMDRGSWRGISVIEAVVEVPILRADGSVLESPGYDEATGIFFYRGDDEFPPVPANPTRDHAIAARDTLLDLVCDFPFVNDATKAAWLAATLTPFARFAFHGCVPFTLTEANQAGAGKGLSTEVSATIWAKSGIACMAYPKDDAEFEKRITALVMSGELFANLDNVRGPLGGPAIEAAMTRTSWNGRELGKSKMTRAMPNNLIWSASANNAVLIGDMPRRTLNIRIEVEEENPEERDGFKYPELLDHVRAHRGELAVACVTILRAYHVAGRPDQRLPPWGSFDAWSKIVRSAVVWAGMADPAATRIELRERADSEGQALRQLVAGWQELDPHMAGLSVADAIALIDGYPDRYSAARQAMAELFGHSKAKPASTKTIGRRLAGFRRRVIGGKRFDCREDRNGVKLWHVELVAGYAGYAGFHSSPSRVREKTELESGEELYEPNPAKPVNPAKDEFYDPFEDNVTIPSEF